MREHKFYFTEHDSTFPEITCHPEETRLCETEGCVFGAGFAYRCTRTSFLVRLCLYRLRHRGSRYRVELQVLAWDGNTRAMRVNVWYLLTLNIVTTRRRVRDAVKYLNEWRTLTSLHTVDLNWTQLLVQHSTTCYTELKGRFVELRDVLYHCFHNFNRISQFDSLICRIQTLILKYYCKLCT